MSAGDDLMTLELTRLPAVVSKEDKDAMCLRSTRRDCSTMEGVGGAGGAGDEI